MLGRLVNLGVPPGTARQDLQNLIREQRWEDAVRQVERLHESAGSGAQAEALAQMLERLVRGLNVAAASGPWAGRRTASPACWS